jgi:hypothetical protein
VTEGKTVEEEVEKNRKKKRKIKRSVRKENDYGHVLLMLRTSCTSM